MANQEEKNKVPLFDGNNYHSWKFRMEILLDELNLLSLVEQPLKFEVVPGTSGTAPEAQLRNNKLKQDDKTCKR